MVLRTLKGFSCRLASSRRPPLFENTRLSCLLRTYISSSPSRSISSSISEVPLAYFR